MLSWLTDHFTRDRDVQEQTILACIGCCVRADITTRLHACSPNTAVLDAGLRKWRGGFGPAQVANRRCGEADVAEDIGLGRSAGCYGEMSE
jgi:hypothetical protein